MTLRALLVDDDSKIVQTVGDILASLNHAHDSAGDQEAARRLLVPGKYAYALLDLEIPVKSGRLCRIENGINLLNQIRETPGMEALPVIVMTGHGNDSPDLAISILTNRSAVYYVKKPFDRGELDRVIQKALALAGGPPAVANGPTVAPGPLRVARGAPGHQPRVSEASGKPAAPQPFQGGELVFYDDRVELCGVSIISNRGADVSMKMLATLRQKETGHFVRRGLKKLAKEIGAAGDGAITGAAKTIRTNAKERLLDELNIVVQDQDVLARDPRKGYHLNDEKVTIRVAGELAPAAAVPDAPPAAAPAPPAAEALNERQKWALGEVRAGREVRRAQIEERFGVSAKTAKRDLAELVERGGLVYVRKPHPGFYRWKG